MLLGRKIGGYTQANRIERSKSSSNLSVKTPYDRPEGIWTSNSKDK